MKRFRNLGVLVALVGAQLAALGSLPEDWPCTSRSLTCPEALGSAPSAFGAQDVAIANSLNSCALGAVSDYEALCRNSGARCGTYTVFAGGVRANGPEYIATGSAVVKCY